MSRKTSYLAIAFLIACPLLGASSDFVERNQEVESAIRLLEIWVEEQREYNQIPGVSIGIIYGPELIWARGFGFSDPENKTPATPATVYRMGSVSKVFTATAIMQLRDQGKLRLDDPVSMHLPEFEISGSFENAQEITVQHLLTHTAGLPREAAFPYWTDHDFPDWDQIQEALPDQTAVYPPGEKYKYSNLGVALLGRIIEAVSGQTYSSYMNDHVFGPLGMANSTALPDASHRQLMAKAYMRKMPDGSRKEMEYYETRGMAPAANIVSSVEDMARFASLHLQSGPSDKPDPVLAVGTLKEMHRPHFVYPSWSGGRGLGFGISHRKGKTLVTHGGWIGGNRSHLLLIPSENIAVVAMTNADDASPSRFSYQAFDVVGPAILEATRGEPASQQASPSWQSLLGLYSDPWDWQYQVMILNEELVMYSHSYPPDDDAEGGLTRLTPTDEETKFMMSDGEAVVFELDAQGKVERIRRRYDYLYPVGN